MDYTTESTLVGGITSSDVVYVLNSKGQSRMLQHVHVMSCNTPLRHTPVDAGYYCVLMLASVLCFDCVLVLDSLGLHVSML